MEVGARVEAGGRWKVEAAGRVEGGGCREGGGGRGETEEPSGGLLVPAALALPTLPSPPSPPPADFWRKTTVAADDGKSAAEAGLLDGEIDGAGSVEVRPVMTQAPTQFDSLALAQAHRLLPRGRGFATQSKRAPWSACPACRPHTRLRLRSFASLSEKKN